MKKFLCVALNVFSISLLTSCGSQPVEEFKPALDPETECKIKIIGDYGNFPALEAEFDRFNAYYPNVTLKYEQLEGYNSALETKLEQEKPNIFFSYTWMIGNEKYNSVVSHMEDLSDPNLKFDLGCIREELINRSEHNKVLMVPVFSRTYGMFVNNDLFKKEGLSAPTTIAELLSTCDALLQKGYKSPMMGFSKKQSNCLMNTIAYPAFLAELSKHPGALELANNKDQRAGEYARPALEIVKNLIDKKYINLTECDNLENDYSAVVKCFLEGEVPMMICAADTPAGVKSTKYWPKSFENNPFEYSFHPIPVTDQGGYYIDSPAREFSVNKNCDNLDMTNEFMRFLISNKELNNMASEKGLLTPTKTISFESMYAPFGKVPANRIFHPEVLGVKDSLAEQIRTAAYKVGKGELTIEKVIEQYGTLS